MAHYQASNLKRMEWNKICREQLSAHIYNRLGILIEPAQVRLKINTDDPYIWEKIEGKEHLFSRNMSDLSTGALKELYEGIGKSFAAVWKPPTRTSQAQENCLHSFNPEVSFTVKINELEECITRLTHELGVWRGQAALESEMKLRAVEEVDQLKKAIQETQKDNRKLEQHVQEWKIIAERSRSSTRKYSKGVSEIWAVLEELISEHPPDGHLLEIPE
ncbi:MAG: hypothetical protein M1840_003738 [Geoglossum simile]|nr:MAG: hypothetical protein M1840_003738 [Geoglossum simile]